MWTAQLQSAHPTLRSSLSHLSMSILVEFLAETEVKVPLYGSQSDFGDPNVQSGIDWEQPLAWATCRIWGCGHPSRILSALGKPLVHRVLDERPRFICKHTHHLAVSLLNLLRAI